MGSSGRSRATVLAAALAAALGLALSAAGGEIHLDETYPLRGRATRVQVLDDGGRPVAGAVVEALYRPNSQTSHRAALAPTDAAGTSEWVPEDAGIVTLTARAPGADNATPPLATTNVAVRFGGFPAPGIFIMVLAGVLLFGGAAAGMWMLLGAPPAVEPPST